MRSCPVERMLKLKGNVILLLSNPCSRRAHYAPIHITVTHLLVVRQLASTGHLPLDCNQYRHRAFFVPMIYTVPKGDLTLPKTELS